MADTALPRGRKSFLLAALPLGLVTLLARAVTFITQLVIANLFGASLETDAYFAAESVVLLLSGLVVIGFSTAFIPLWMEYRVQQGEVETHQFSDAFASLATVVTVVLGVAMALSAPLIARAIAPGFSSQAADTTTWLLRVMALAVVLLGFTAGCTSLLEAHQHFLVPAFSRVVYSAVILVVVVTLSNRLDVMALAWGTVIAAIARLLVQWPNVWRLGGIRLTWRMDHPGVRRAIRLILPILVALVGTEVMFLLDNMVASLLPAGALTRLAYANRVILLPVGILALPLRTTIFPTLSHYAAHRQLEAVGKTVLGGMRLLAFVMIPVSAGMLVLRQPLIHLLFERGAFDSAAAHLTAGALGWYALGVPAMGGLMLISNAYFALGDPVALVKLNLFNWLSNLILNLALLGPLGHNGIALATSLSCTATCTLAVLGLKRRLPAVDIWSLAGSLAKVTLATGGMVGAMLGGNALLIDSLNGIVASSALQALTTLLAGGMIGTVAYVLAALVLRTEEMTALVSTVLQRVLLRS
jgi:putative peptidoglycan lipid II flippase